MYARPRHVSFVFAKLYRNNAVRDRTRQIVSDKIMHTTGQMSTRSVDNRRLSFFNLHTCCARAIDNRRPCLFPSLSPFVSTVSHRSSPVFGDCCARTVIARRFYRHASTPCTRRRQLNCVPYREQRW